MDTNINRAIGKGLKDIRKKKNLSQKVLASRMGRLQSYVSKIEQGERALRVAEVFEYAEALDVNWQDLMLDVKVWVAKYNNGERAQEQGNSEDNRD